MGAQRWVFGGGMDGGGRVAGRATVQAICLCTRYAHLAHPPPCTQLPGLPPRRPAGRACRSGAPLPPGHHPAKEGGKEGADGQGGHRQRSWGRGRGAECLKPTAVSRCRSSRGAGGGMMGMRGAARSPARRAQHGPSANHPAMHRHICSRSRKEVFHRVYLVQYLGAEHAHSIAMCVVWQP
jgi:hypothetical protein